ncbi:MAG: hypothetical protein ACXVA9_05735, partial [Bdellovibrionales bacterium]
MIFERPRWTTALLFLFALSFTFFAIQSGDALMYLTLVRDYLIHGEWPAFDPYLYSLPHAELHIAHEYLSYFIFYGFWSVLGFGGLILLKMIILGILFALTLRAGPREQNSSSLWIGLWLLAVLAASFRFIERTSLFSDLFSVLLIYWLVDAKQLTRSLLIRLTVLFLLWVQLHPGYPLGLAILAIWAGWNSYFNPDFRKANLPWLLLPVLCLLINPLVLDGALYPFRFAFNEALVLKHHNFEWFPTYHEAFRWTPEVIGYWSLLTATLFLLWREKAWLSLRGILALFVVLAGIQAVRFVPWTSFALLILIKPWAVFKIRARYLVHFLTLVMVLAIFRNVIWGYTGSSGPRTPQIALDKNFFPVETVEFLRAHPLAGNLYNAHDFGSYLLWVKMAPIFHHGFVTDMDFYENDVAGLFQSQARFLELAKKYNWTKLLVDKHGSYPYFYKILSPLPEWKIVSEDDAAYLIY